MSEARGSRPGDRGAGRLRAGIVSLACALLLAAPRDGAADCCRLIKTDTETPPATVRVCEAAPSGGCDAALWVGTLALGESIEVCPATPNVRYAEFDDATADFAPPVDAVCQGDVEI